MIDPGSPAVRWRWANSRQHRNVPLRVMSTTVRHALGDMSSAGTGKLAAALLTSTWGSPNDSVAPSNVPGFSAVSPGGGGWGRPERPVGELTSAPSVDGRALVVLGGAHFSEILALVDERLVDELVAHRRLLQRTSHASDDPPGHLH